MKSNAKSALTTFTGWTGVCWESDSLRLTACAAMFVANLTPIVIVTAAAGLETSQTAALIQNAMFIAGVATLIQLYPVWRIGAKLQS